MDERTNEQVPDRESGGLPLKLWRALARAHAALGSAAADEAVRHGLSVGELEVLHTLRRRGPLGVGELQRRVRVSSGGATYLVTRLETRGLVERRGSPWDRRARLVGLTAAGEEAAAAAVPAYVERIRRALSGMSKKDRRALLLLLEELEESCAETERGAAEQRAERVAFDLSQR